MASYYKVLSEAVDDLLTRGFVSATQVAVWQARLKDAAEAGFWPETSTLAERALTGVFTRLIERGGISRFHVGLAPSTLDRLRPELRSELTKFLLSSSAFLRARREEALLASLRLFAGWASSIPPGGVPLGTRKALRVEIKRPLASLPFEENRAVVAQSAHLTTALNTLIARRGEALAAQWHSRWKQPGYAYREDHKENDLKIFVFKGTWAISAGLLRRGPYAEDQPVPGTLRGCQCSYRFFYDLAGVPRELLTAKGLASLAAAA